jgi:hypothetical protein
MIMNPNLVDNTLEMEIQVCTNKVDSSLRGTSRGLKWGN